MRGAKLLIVGIILAVIGGWFFNRIGVMWEATGVGFRNLEQMRLMGLLPGYVLQSIIADPLAFSLARTPLMWTAAAETLVILGLIYAWSLMETSSRTGEEHGSAKQANPVTMRKFARWGNPNPFNTFILSERFGLALSRKRFNIKYDRNLNIAVFGGLGTGKTLRYVEPNICQLNTNLLVTDPKGTTYGDTGWMLANAGYNVIVFNTVDPRAGMHYNPFHYLKEDIQVVSFVHAFFKMTSDSQKKGGDQFFDDSAEGLMCGLIALLRDYYPSDYNIGGLLKLVDMIEIDEARPYRKSALDLIFDEIATGVAVTVVDSEGSTTRGRGVSGPSKRVIQVRSSLVKRTEVNGHRRSIRIGDRGGLSPEEDWALEEYRSFKSGAAKTVMSIKASLNARLRPLRAHGARELLCGPDEMHLEDIGRPDKKTALFSIFDDGEAELGFLHGMLVWQAINTAKTTADLEFNGRLPRPFRCILDEFRTLQLPSMVAGMISIIRSRNISMDVILQSVVQLQEIYDEPTANAIVDCCATTVFLGGKSTSTTKLVSESLGQQTVQTKNTSTTRGSGQSSVSTSTSGRAFMDEAEVSKISGDQCIVQIAGMDGIVDKKYDIQKHPNYERVRPLDDHRGISVRFPVFKTWKGPLDGDEERAHLALRLPVVRNRKLCGDKPFAASKSCGPASRARRASRRSGQIEEGAI